MNDIPSSTIYIFFHNLFSLVLRTHKTYHIYTSYIFLNKKKIYRYYNFVPLSINKKKFWQQYLDLAMINLTI